MDFLKFSPVLCERVWGGQSFKRQLGREMPPSATIGESWEVCDRPDVESVVCDGEFKGFKINDLLRVYGKEIMGKNWDCARRFPLIIKWLDCRQRLSLQVHPTLEAAKKLGSEPKTEAWYFLKCDERAKFVAGLKSGIDMDSLSASVRDSNIEKSVRFFNARDGDFILIKSGCVHAIGAGNLVLEIQQNSDTTYRIYDWNRPDINGKMRDLHIAESVLSVDLTANTTPIQTESSGIQVLCDTAHFKILKYNVDSGDTITFNSGRPRIISVIKGDFVSENGIVKCFDNILLPSCNDFSFKAVGDVSLLVTDNF